MWEAAWEAATEPCLLLGLRGAATRTKVPEAALITRVEARLATVPSRVKAERSVRVDWLDRLGLVGGTSRLTLWAL